jgi:hypothetical protein
MGEGASAESPGERSLESALVRALEIVRECARSGSAFSGVFAGALEGHFEPPRGIPQSIAGSRLTAFEPLEEYPAPAGAGGALVDVGRLDTHDPMRVDADVGQAHVVVEVTRMLGRFVCAAAKFLAAGKSISPRKNIRCFRGGSRLSLGC